MSGLKLWAASINTLLDQHLQPNIKLTLLYLVSHIEPLLYRATSDLFINASR